MLYIGKLITTDITEYKDEISQKISGNSIFQLVIELAIIQLYWYTVYRTSYIRIVSHALISEPLV